MHLFVALTGECLDVQAIRSINNNIAICVDSAGTECIVMGKGVGYGKMPHEVNLSDVTHTYYGADERDLSGIKEIPSDILQFAAGELDWIRGLLPYPLSPNADFLLADHIAFAIKRSKEQIKVRLPLSYEVKQDYPQEYAIGEDVVRRIRRAFSIDLPEEEVVGIALNLVNARSGGSECDTERVGGDDAMLEEITGIVEDELGVVVDRDSFAFSRYASHLRYLFSRIQDNETLSTRLCGAYEQVVAAHPDYAKCVDAIARHVYESWGIVLDDDEKLYLALHVSRICTDRLR